MATWRGDELLERADWRHEPGADEWAELALDGPPAALAARLARVGHELEHGGGAVLMRGLPVERWGEARAARAFARLAEGLGTALPQDVEGTRLFRVRDEGFAEGDPRFRGPSSARRLRFHTDRCDVIAFLCVRPALEGGDTRLVSSEALAGELERTAPEHAAALRGPFPYLRHTIDGENPRAWVELPVFSRCEGRFAGHLLRVLIERADASPDAPSLTDAQRAALDALDALAEDPTWQTRLSLAPGDVLLLNNWTTFHRRDAFRDGGAQRLLLRIWLSMPNSRAIDPAFAPHFGATGAGELRGGIRSR